MSMRRPARGMPRRPVIAAAVVGGNNDLQE
jgi:hypothetical protein